MSDPTIEISISDVYWKETANCPNCTWFASIPFPTVYDNRVGSFTSPANHFNTEDAGEDLKVFERLERFWKSFADVITKAALSSNSQLF